MRTGLAILLKRGASTQARVARPVSINPEAFGLVSHSDHLCRKRDLLVALHFLIGTDSEGRFA